MNRNYFLALTVGIILLAVNTLNAQNRIVVNNTVPGMTIVKVSENGKYVVGSQLAVQGFLWEPENGNKITLLNELVSGNKCEGKDVTNDGLVVGYINVELGKDGMPAYWKDGKWTMLPCPNIDDVHGSAQAVAADGSFILGYTSHRDYVCTPCLWRRNDEGKYEVEVIRGTEKDQVEMEVRWGFTIDDMSLDGTVWSGRLYDHDHQCQGVLWQPECMIYGKELFYDKEGEVIYDDNGLTMDFQYAMVNKISPNGRYISGPTMRGTSTSIIHKPFVYDREKGKFIFINHSDAISTITSNDGLTFYASPINGLTREGFVYNNETKETVSMQDWLFTNYQLDLGTELGLGGLTGTIEDLNSDRSVMVGNLAITSDYKCFWIKMDNQGEGVNSEKINQLSFSVSGNKLYVNGELETISVRKVTGETVYEATLTENIVDMSFLHTGIYLVTINGQGGVMTQKMVIR